MGDFKIIVVIVPGIKSLMKLIIGYTMKCLIVDPSAVISMDHLTHKPEILFHPGGLIAHPFHKIKIKYICCIQTDSINIKGIDPETDHIKKILHYLWISLI